MKHLLPLLCLGALLSAGPTAPHIETASTAYGNGKAAEQQKRFDRAIDFFRKAIEIEPTFMDARYGLIDVYLESGQQLKAAAAITQLLQIEPNADRYRLALGRILLEQKQQRRALAQFSAVLKNDPYNADALLGFASAARRMGMADRAAEALNRGRQRYPQDKRFQAAIK